MVPPCGGAIISHTALLRNIVLSLKRVRGAAVSAEKPTPQTTSLGRCHSVHKTDKRCIFFSVPWACQGTTPKWTHLKNIYRSTGSSLARWSKNSRSVWWSACCYPGPMFLSQDENCSLLPYLWVLWNAAKHIQLSGPLADMKNVGMQPSDSPG